VELVPVAGAEAPAAGPSMEALAGVVEAPAGVTEVPPAIKEEEAGILQLEVSSISPRVSSISRGGLSLFRFFAYRVTPTIPTLMPAKALKLGMPATTRWRSERALLTAASEAATGESSRVTTATTRPQQEEAAAATSQALVPRAPPQGCGQAHSESQPTRDHGAAGATADDDAPPGWGQLRGRPRSAPERVPEVPVMREDGCVMSQRPTHDAEASMSHAALLAPDVAAVHP
jgi:hypothetical protein